MGGDDLRQHSWQRQDFERIFDASPSPQLLLSPEFTIVGVNAAYLKATMTRREEIMGRGMFEVFPDNPDDPQASGVRNLRTSLVRVLETGLPDTMPVQKYDIARPAAAGGGFEERWWSPVNVPVFEGDGRLSCIIHRVEDVTAYVRLGREAALPAAARFGHPQALELVGRNRELYEANQAQALANEQLRLALKAGHAGTFARDAESGCCRCSEESLGLYGLDAFGGRYRDWLDCVLPADRSAVHEAVQRAFPSGEIELDFRIRRLVVNGQALVLEATRDITESKRLEGQLRMENRMLDEEVRAQMTELQAANADLERRNQELQQFAYVAAHDLQTPLRSIVGFAQLLQKDHAGRFDAQADTWLAELGKAGKRMHMLIANLLDYSRLDSQDGHFERVSMSRLFNDVRATLDGPIRAAGTRQGQHLLFHAAGMPSMKGAELASRARPRAMSPSRCVGRLWHCKARERPASYPCVSCTQPQRTTSSTRNRRGLIFGGSFAMLEQLRRYRISCEVDGQTYHGNFWVAGKILVVSTAKGGTSRQLGERDPEALATRLLLELAREGKV